MVPVHLQRELNEARHSLLSQDFARALPQYERLVRRCPGAALIWFEYGNAAARLRQVPLAERAWLKAMELDRGNSELLAMVGHQYQGLRKPERARECFVRACAADARAINPRISLAVLLEQQHHLEESRRAVEECLAIDPHDDQARYFAAVLDRRSGDLEPAERRMRDLIRSEPKHPYVRYSCRYELALVCDRTGRFDEAIRLLSEAKQIVRALTDTDLLLKGYDERAERARAFTHRLPKTILHTWAKDYPERKRERIPAMAFLGGHPRSGTTLLEQVLDAHPGVAALDEPTAFLEVLEPAFHKTSNHSNERLNVLRRLYTGALLEEAGPEAVGKLLIDKNPSPTGRLPVWLRVFPELRILIALRDPRDVVLSCYFQNLPLNATNVNFLSFQRLAKHYADLMDIWLMVREWEGFAWQETRYEDLVANFENEGLRLTEFLGLTWHDEQACFYEKTGSKQLYSPTYQDVTRPVYTRSVARWRSYEQHLAPVLSALQPYCHAFGYE
jgi:Tfp pilus assembly protein PilF